MTVVTMAGLERENREQHSEILQLYKEIDHYRRALEAIMEIPGGIWVDLAKAALRGSSRADTRQ